MYYANQINNNKKNKYDEIFSKLILELHLSVNKKYKRKMNKNENALFVNVEKTN